MVAIEARVGTSWMPSVYQLQEEWSSGMLSDCKAIGHDFEEF